MGFQSSELLSILAHLSYAVPLVLLPSLLYYVFDTLGWRYLLPGVSRNLTFLQSLRIHISSEAIVKTIPFGVPLADSIRVMLLKREHSISALDGLSSAIYRRLYLGLSQGVYLVTGGLLGFSLLQASLANAIAPGFVEWIPVGTGALLVIVLLLALILLSSPKVRNQVIQLCLRLPWIMFRKRLIRLVESPISTERHFHGLFTRSTGMTLMWFFVYWCVEAVETFVFMALLEIPISISQVAAIETVVSSIRLAAFFLPSGIGVQDIGYAAMMISVGCVSAPGDAAGFVLLKRTKDFFWILLGYTLLVARGIKPFRKSTLAQTS